MDEFSALGLSQSLVGGFAALGFKSPTHTQALAIPSILAQKDTVVLSETGTGKTFAYIAPILQALEKAKDLRGPAALVICPTQELAVQVAKQVEILASASRLGVQALTLLGGSPISRQAAALHKNPSILIGTPGRSSDLIRMGYLKTRAVEFLVLDEVERLVDKEYLEAVDSILREVGKNCVKIFASATSSPRLRRFIAKTMDAPNFVELLSEGVLSGDIEHWVFYVEPRKRIDFLKKFESVVHPSRCLLFAERSDRVERIAERLKGYGLPADSILAKQDKEHRRVSLERFARGKIRYLVTSDLGARGLDIPEVSHVVSLDFPENPSLYVHRAGRTGRAGRKGVSVVLADGVDLPRASRVAVERGFVFRTRALEGGAMYEPPVEEFFETVDRKEAERRESRGKPRRAQG